MIKTVAIHQPNFFPWLGYFDKIARSDTFIFLDNVQYPKTGGVWSNRVKMLVAGEARWVTAPIIRTFHGLAQINEIEWADNQPWRVKLIKTLAANYSKAGYYREIMVWLEPLILMPEANLARYNMAVIRAIAEKIGLRCEHCIVASSLSGRGQASELLIDLTHKVNGDVYLSGGGAAGYQEDKAFTAAGLELRCQSFVHPAYEQFGGCEFVPGLSIVDAMMNLGSQGVARLMRRNV